MRKPLLMVVILVSTLAWSTPAAADTILFDLNGAGGGGVVSADALDWTPGNSLLDQTTGTVLYQSNLFGTTLNGLPTGTNGSLGTWFTGVAAIDVTVAGAGFTVDPGGTFRIYADVDPGNNLSGEGFAMDADAVVILEGTAISGFGNLAPVPTAPQTLDQFGGDNYGTDSIVGIGSFQINIAVTSWDPLYFPLGAGTFLFQSVAAGSNQLPFTQVDPSACFSSNAIADCDTMGVGAVGPINGLGPIIIAQSDASSTFSVIPEPATLTLLGIGLAGSAVARRRQLKKRLQQ